MGSPIALSHLTLSDLEGSSQGHQDLEALYIVREPSYALCYYYTLIGNHICNLLLTIDRKPHMLSAMAPLHLTLSDLDGSSQGHQDLEALYHVREPSYALCYY